MTSRVEKLIPASFRRVSFLVPEENEATGQKVALHEYPNSSRRFAEPLGVIPPTFSLVGIVHGPNFIQRRLDLKNALNTPGLGELVHPIYGSIQVQPLPYTVDSNQVRVGEIIFRMQFATSDAVVTPNPLQASPQTATRQAVVARNAANTVLENNYTPPTDILETNEISDNINELLTDIENASRSVVEPVQANLAAFNTAVSTARTGLFRIIQTGANLRDSINSVYTTMLNISDEPENILAAWNSLFDFNIATGTNFSSLRPTNTVSRARTQQNIASISEHARLIALIGIMESTAHTSFLTQEDLLAALENINTRFNNYLENNLIPQPNIDSIANDPTFRASLHQLRVFTKTSLDAQISNIWRIADIDPGRSSISLTAYRYYGDLENVERLTGLNPNLNVANFNQTIRAITR